MTGENDVDVARSGDILERCRFLSKILGVGHFDLPRHYRDAADEIERLRAVASAAREMLAKLEDIEGKCADVIGGRINYRAGDLQVLAREGIAAAHAAGIGEE